MGCEERIEVVLGLVPDEEPINGSLTAGGSTEEFSGALELLALIDAARGAAPTREAR